EGAGSNHVTALDLAVQPGEAAVADHCLSPVVDDPALRGCQHGPGMAFKGPGLNLDSLWFQDVVRTEQLDELTGGELHGAGEVGGRADHLGLDDHTNPGRGMLAEPLCGAVARAVLDQED